VDAAALNLYSFYAGIQRVQEMVADGIDETKFSVPASIRGLGPHRSDRS
jgi:hypothetical protein